MLYLNKMNEFNQKLDKYPEPIHDLTKGQTVLVKVKTNSRKITFQPCTVVSPDPVLNSNGYPVLEFKTPSGTITQLYCRKQGGEAVVIGIQSSPTVIGFWKTKEMKKLTAELEEVQARIELVNSL